MTESNNQETIWVLGMIVMLGIIALGIFAFAALIPGSPVLGEGSLDGPLRVAPADIVALVVLPFTAH